MPYAVDDRCCNYYGYGRIYILQCHFLYCHSARARVCVCVHACVRVRACVCVWVCLSVRTCFLLSFSCLCLPVLVFKISFLFLCLFVCATRLFKTNVMNTCVRHTFQSQNSGRVTVGRIVHCASIVNVDPTYNYPTVGRQHLEYGMFCLKGLLLLIHPVCATVIYFP